MDELILMEIGRQVYTLDDAFIDSRIGTIEKATQWNGDLYLNWRRYLLGKKVKEKKLLARVHGDRRDEYAKFRYAFLERKFDKSDHSHIPRSTSQTSLHSSASSNSLHSDVSGDGSPPPSPRDAPPQRGRSQSQDSAPKIPPPKIPESQSLKNLSTKPEQKPDTGDYTFSGMHHIFAETTRPITCISFGTNDNDLLAFGSAEGHIYLCNSFKSPRVLHVLKGHTSAITALRWNGANDALISSALDSVRVWDRKTGLPIRVIKEMGVACCLNPLNENSIFISDTKGYIKVINANTGKSVLRVKALANVTSMQFDMMGHFLFAGDEKGFVEVFKYTKESGALQLINKTAATNRPVTKVEYKGIYSKQQYSPSLLVNSKDSTIRIFVMKNSPTAGTLGLLKEYKIKGDAKSTWCPRGDAPFFVTGSDNGSVTFYDMRNIKDKPINTLMGHGAPVTDANWASDETLLATADAGGMVILWKKVS